MPDEPSVLGLNNLNFFDYDYLNDHSDIPNDENRNDPIPNSKEERSANHEDNLNSISEGNGPLFSSQNDQDIPETQNLRRSSRPSVFLKNYKDFVVESKVKYGLGKYVYYSHLSKDNYCFTFVLNESFKPKSFEEVAKHQP
ncbi:hypothetical protein Tco_1414197 [Tanacetum coccineum]